jgi:hypothetical protein
MSSVLLLAVTGTGDGALACAVSAAACVPAGKALGVDWHGHACASFPVGIYKSSYGGSLDVTGLHLILSFCIIHQRCESAHQGCLKGGLQLRCDMWCEICNTAFPCTPLRISTEPQGHAHPSSHALFLRRSSKQSRRLPAAGRGAGRRMWPRGQRPPCCTYASKLPHRR